MDHLLFRLYGPLSAWGDTAVGEVRPSFPYPTKSAVLGLIGGALGLSRDADERHLQLASQLGLAIRVLNSGTYLRDYHTIQAPAPRKNEVLRTRRDEVRATKLNTILSSREYRADGLYVIALWASADAADDLLQTVATALAKPVYIPCLGRRSCPLALPMQAQIVSAASLKEAFTAAEFADEPALPDQSGGVVYFDLDHPEAGLEVSETRIRKDQLISRRRWQFADRAENVATMEV